MPIPSGTLTTTANAPSTFIATALDLEVAPYLRQEPIFRQFADRRPQRQAHAGLSVKVTIEGELALATTPLDESLDVDSVAPPAVREVTVTMNEYGNAATKTLKLQVGDWSQDTAGRIGRELGKNAVRSVDKIYQTALDGASNVTWMAAAGPVAATPGAANITKLTSLGVHTAKTLLSRRAAEPWFGTHVACVIHPDVLMDLKEQTGAGAWRTPNENGAGAVQDLYNGTTHDWMGVRFVENNNCTISTVAVGTGPDVYNTYFLGREGLIELVGKDVSVVVADPVDQLNRFMRIGWHALLGVSRFRENAIQLLKSSSTIETDYFADSLPTLDGKA